MSGDGLPGDLHDDTECRSVLEDVYRYLDGELTGQGRTVIQQHLDDCTPCLRKYGLEQGLKALIARCCGQEETPTHLRERVLSTLRSVTVVEQHGGGATVTTTTTVSQRIVEER